MVQEKSCKIQGQTGHGLGGRVGGQDLDLARLTTGHARFQTILESATHAIIVVNDQGLIVEWSNQAELLCGWGHDDIVGKPIFCIMPSKYHKEHKNILPMVLNGERGFDFGKRIETTILNRNDFEVPVELSVFMARIGARQEFYLFMHDITERKKYEEQLHQMSITDELTGLFNRRGFMKLADRQLKSACRDQDDVFMLYADFDNMKWINDNLGHQVGDHALIETATILRKTFRQVDLIGRVGGDEFIVLITDDEKKNPLAKVLSRLEKKIAAANNRKGRDYKILLSIGTVHYDHNATCSVDELMSKADQLMYESKREKKMSGHYSHV